MKLRDFRLAAVMVVVFLVVLAVWIGVGLSIRAGYSPHTLSPTASVANS